MNDQILNTILGSSYTLHELRKRLRILKAFVGKKLFGSDTTEDDLEIRSELNWLQQLGEPFYNQFNSNNFSQIFQEMGDRIEKLTPLIIYFAFEPNEEELHNVGGWLRKNYGSTFLFDAKLDPSLIGGCAFVWKGLYRDYSLRGKIESNRQTIIQIMSNSINTNK